MLQDRVVAFLLEDMIQGAEWKIEHVPQHGTDAYMCETRPAFVLFTVHGTDELVTLPASLKQTGSTDGVPVMRSIRRWAGC